MRKFLLFIIISIIPTGYLSVGGEGDGGGTAAGNMELYAGMELEGVVNFDAFCQAIAGYNSITAKKRDILTLIDFTKPSTEKRFYVFDMVSRRMLFHSHVSHGRGSGDNYATSFSNVSGSYKSSLGFYLTGSTYQGGNGYSLLLDGLERGINDNARRRAIVIHGAAYSNPSYIASCGRLGRSHGCPALPEAITREVIDAIKGGSVLYIYAGNDNYVRNSRVLARQAAGTGSLEPA